VVDSCEHGNDLSGSIRVEFIEILHRVVELMD
jgi:hypothetical protein